MFRLESLELTTTKKDFIEELNSFKNCSLLFTEITINVEFVNFMNVFDRETLEITLCDDSYCVNVYDYSTKELLTSDMYFESLDDICQYFSEIYFENEEE